MPPIAILLLEDSPLDAELIGARLSKGGIDYAMRRVETRGEFLAALRAGPIDLILADYSLPSFDGLAALELARHECPDTPFLFVSGGLGEEVAIDSLKRGATDYVLKQKLDRLAPAVTRAITEARERAERRRTEAALRESERRHRLILESVEDYAILLLDPEGRVCGWNRGAERILGLPESEALGSPVARIFAPEDAHAGRPEAELRRAAALGRSEDERWYVRHGGERFWGGGVVRPLSDETGRLRGFVKVVHDMTERRRVEEALREADRRKDEFLAMLAHELRNPLAPILNAMKILGLRGDGDPATERTRAMVEEQVKHMARLIDDLLDVSRIT
ncbi:MAG TPA: PAS domain S-box protein, partial [Isosphaeraceae bacterium]